MSRILDISRPLSSASPVWPGDEPFRFRWTARVDPAIPGSANLGAIAGSAHVGTHVDAPLHVLADGAPLDALDLAVFVGPCRVVAVGSRGTIEPAALAGWDPAEPPRVLFKTGSHPDRSRLPERFAALNLATAEALVRGGVRLVGIDTPSVDLPEALDLPVHRRFARAGVVGLENLDLAAVPPGLYELIALPLRVVGAEGSPVRAVLIAP